LVYATVFVVRLFCHVTSFINYAMFVASVGKFMSFRICLDWMYMVEYSEMK